MGLDRLVEDLGNIDDDVIEAAIRAGRQGIPLVKNDELDEEDGDIDETTEKGFSKPGFWSEGEESLGPDEDYYADDITSTAHGQLEQHRELREYARLIAWELPLLSRMFTLRCMKKGITDMV
jgi:small subunit ribosomal protein S35